MNQRRREFLRDLILWLPALTFLAVLYLYPLVSIITLSLQRSQSGPAGAFIEAVTSPSILKVLWFTIWQAALSTLLTLAVGLPGAFLLARYDFRGKSLLQALSAIPFVMPTMVVAVGFYALLGGRGWINLGLMNLFNLDSPPIQFINTLWAILLAHVFYNTTIVLRLVGDYWSHLDPRLGQAARTLGANRWQTLRRITLPLLMPAITTAALLVFLFDFTSFGVILVLGGPRYATLEVEIYNQTVSLFNLPLAAVLALIQLGFTLALTIVYTRLMRRLTRPIVLKPQKYTQRRLTSWRSRLMAGVIISMLVILLMAPLAALALRSFTRLEADRGQRSFTPGFTLDFYRELGNNSRQSSFYTPPVNAIGISLGYAGLTMILALGLGIPTAWALAKKPGARFTRLLDPLIMLPLGTSAVTLGLGFIVALDHPPLDWRASPLLIPLAHTLVAFPFVVRSLSPSFQSIRPRLRQAAAVLGATPLQVFRAVDLPLAGRAVLMAAIFAGMISLGEFGATAMIARPEYTTVPVAIYRFLSHPGGINYGQALALGTILMIITSLGMIITERLRIAEIGEF